MTDFDIAIIGAGPAGCATALALQDSGLSVALIDKAVFPRDKICGDALSPDVVNQLHKLPMDTGTLFDGLEQKIQCKAVRFVSPSFKWADLQLGDDNTSGYVATRLSFDHFMFTQACKPGNVKAWCGAKVHSIARSPEYVTLGFEDGKSVSARVVVGADGAHSIVSRLLSKHRTDPAHQCAGLRMYYENVTGFSSDNAVELHFYKELLPGYFWVFPLPNNRANVGLGMLTAHISQKRVNIKDMLMHMIHDHPNVAPRFAHARPLENIKGYGLPLGSKKRSLSGANYLLTGDAASLINPLSGEGIANALRSGRIAAQHLQEAFRRNDFTAEFNREYDRQVYRVLWDELRINYWLQLAMRKPALCNFIIEKALRNPQIQKMVLSGFNIKKVKRQFLKPGFYLSFLQKQRNQ